MAEIPTQAAPRRKHDKPPYRIPSVKEMLSTERNGFDVVSTFSGCGGACLGLEWAGFNVAWANEFVPAAADTYDANHPIKVNRSDIRTITADQIREEAKQLSPQLDILEGSPPCASFSTAGKTNKHWGKSKKYSDVEQVVDDLFFEFIRLLKDLQPRVVLAENVPGLNRGVAKGYLIRILDFIRQAGYNVEAKYIDAVHLGVPQRRRRIIFIGVRKDLYFKPDLGFPKPLPYQPYTIREAIEGLEHAPVEPEADLARFAIGKEWNTLNAGEQSKKYFNLVRAHPDKPCPTVTQTGGVSSAASVAHPFECRKFSIAELRRICGFPDDFVLTGDYRQQYERLGRAVPPPMYKAVGDAIAENILRKVKR